MAEVRVGVVLRPQSPPEELRETVVAADEAGLDELWLGFPEHGLGAAAAALTWSERLTVGIGLLPPRDPAVAATEIAMVARLFPGRFVPAVGPARTAHAVTVLREHADAVRRLLHGETVEVTGQLDAVGLDRPPEQVPPRILGAREPETLALAGEVGDGVLLDACFVTPKYVASASARVAQAAQAAGRPAPRVVTFAEIEPEVPALGDRARALIAELAAAGADSVVLQCTSQHPDPGPLIAALSR